MMMMAECRCDLCNTSTVVFEEDIQGTATNRREIQPWWWCSACGGKSGIDCALLSDECKRRLSIEVTLATGFLGDESGAVIFVATGSHSGDNS